MLKQIARWILREELVELHRAIETLEEEFLVLSLPAIVPPNMRTDKKLKEIEKLIRSHRLPKSMASNLKEQDNEAETGDRDTTKPED